MSFSPIQQLFLYCSCILLAASIGASCNPPPVVRIDTPQDGDFLQPGIFNFTFKGNITGLPLGGRFRATKDRNAVFFEWRGSQNNECSAPNPGDFCFARILEGVPQNPLHPFHPLHTVDFEILDSSGQRVSFSFVGPEQGSEIVLHKQFTLVSAQSVPSQGTAMAEKNLLFRTNDNPVGLDVVERRAELLFTQESREIFDNLISKNPTLSAEKFREFVPGVDNDIEVHLDHVAHFIPNTDMIDPEAPLTADIELDLGDNAMLAEGTIRDLSIGFRVLDVTVPPPPHCQGLPIGQPCVLCQAAFEIRGNQVASLHGTFQQEPAAVKRSQIDIDQISPLELNLQCNFRPTPNNTCDNPLLVDLLNCSSPLSAAIQKKVLAEVLDDKNGPDDPKDEDGLLAKVAQKALAGFDIAGLIGESIDLALNAEFSEITEIKDAILYTLNAGVRATSAPTLRGCLQIENPPNPPNLRTQTRSAEHNEYGITVAVSDTAFNQTICAAQDKGFINLDLDKVPEGTGLVNATGDRVRRLFGIEELTDIAGVQGAVGPFEDLRLRVRPSAAPPVVDPLFLLPTRNLFLPNELSSLLGVVGVSGLKVDILKRSTQSLILSLDIDLLAGFDVDPRRLDGTFLPRVLLTPLEQDVECGKTPPDLPCKRVVVRVSESRLIRKSDGVLLDTELEPRLKGKMLANASLGAFIVRQLLTRNPLPLPSIEDVGLKSVDERLALASLKNYVSGFFAFGITPELYGSVAQPSGDRKPIGDQFINASSSASPNNPTVAFDVRAIHPESDIAVDLETFPAAADFPLGAYFRGPIDNPVPGAERVGRFEWTPLLIPDPDPDLAVDQTGIYTIQFSAVSLSSDDRRAGFRARENVKFIVCQPGARCTVELSPVGNKTAAARQELRFGLSARGPEGFEIGSKGVSIQLKADPAKPPKEVGQVGLPKGAQVLDHKNGTATFAWTPSDAQRGVHRVRFIAESGRLTRDEESIAITVMSGTESGGPER